MIEGSDLDAAVQAGVIGEPEAERLTMFLRERRHAVEIEAADEENLRFLNSFNDVFVTIGLALLFGAIAYFAASFGPVIVGLAACIIAWLLAEHFTRRRRMALPSIVLLLLFVSAVFLTALMAFTTVGRSPIETPEAVAGAALVALLGAGAHWRRYRVPITVAAGFAAAAGAVVAIAYTLAPDLVLRFANPIWFSCGVLAFVAAMRFDITDLRRVTRRTDMAFWLHLLAAPLIVHPIAGTLLEPETPTRAGPVALLALFVLIAIVAVLIDRRALLVSGLSYAIYAFGTLLGPTALTAYSLPASMLILGAMVLLLSASWRPVRAALLALAPGAVTRLVPSPSSASSQ